MKFKILPKVHRFVDPQGFEHSPGEIVDLPETYLGESWLEPVDKPGKVEAPPAKVEPAAEVKHAVPFEAKKSRKTK